MIRHSAKYLEIGLEILAQVHDGSDIATAVTVIRCRPDSDDVLVFEVILKELAGAGIKQQNLVTYFVAFVDKLMRASDELKAVDMVELISVSLRVRTVTN